MTYEDAFKKIKEKFKGVKTDSFDEFFAIQVTLTDDDCGGIFYIEYKDGKLSVQPYDYIDRTTAIAAPRAELMKVINGTAIAQNAIEKGKIEIGGNTDCFIKLADALKAANKKPSAKKATVKKSAPVKKAETEKKTPVKKASAAKKAEQIKLNIPEKSQATKKADNKSK